MPEFARLIVFGVIAGATWSIAPMLLQGPSPWLGDLKLYLLGLGCGATTGMILALATAPLLKRSGASQRIAIGLLSLPFGAFVYGNLVAALNRLATADYSYGTFEVGFMCAAVSLSLPIVLVLAPLAVSTAWLLHRLVRPFNDKA